MEIKTALVLGSGGATGIAWQLGVLIGLAKGGVQLQADKVIGTSAGAVVAARLTTGADLEQLAAGLGRELAGFERTPLSVLPILLAAQLYPSRRHAVVGLGRRAERSWTAQAEASWIAQLVPDLAGRAWPKSLVIVATDASTGRPAYFTAAQPVELPLAVAASCALPGVFPAVKLDARLHFDGGLRSPANLDLAIGAASVIALAAPDWTIRAHRRPDQQARLLQQDGVKVQLVRPDAASVVAMGADPLAGFRAAEAVAAGLSQGKFLAEELGGEWPR